MEEILLLGLPSSMYNEVSSLPHPFRVRILSSLTFWEQDTRGLDRATRKVPSKRPIVDRPHFCGFGLTSASWNSFFLAQFFFTFVGLGQPKAKAGLLGFLTQFFFPLSHGTHYWLFPANHRFVQDRITLLVLLLTQSSYQSEIIHNISLLQTCWDLRFLCLDIGVPIREYSFGVSISGFARLTPKMCTSSFLG